MNPLYNTGIHAFASIVKAGAVKSPKLKLLCAGQRRTIAWLHKLKNEDAPGFDVWFHAASLGEFEQVRPLIERLRRDCPHKRLLLTFFSPSGYEVRKNYDKVDHVAYLPFDTPANARLFVEAVKPGIAIFSKYEFWGNYLQQLKHSAIPTYIISSIFRPGQRFFKPWGGMFRKMLDCYTHLYVQDADSKHLLSSIGLDNVTVAGDTRFDRVSDILTSAKTVDAVARLSDNSAFTLIAGSSWPKDEDIYIPWLKQHPDVKAVIAPHEFDHDRVDKLWERLGSDHTALLSQCNSSNSDSIDYKNLRYIIVDCFGLLSSIYRYGSAALIGGGFGAGIHNLNEAAVYSIPVLFGPNHKKFKEASDLIACGGGFSFSSDAEFEDVADRLVSNPDALKKAGDAAGQYIHRNIGASDIIYSDIFNGNTTTNI